MKRLPRILQRRQNLCIPGTIIVAILLVFALPPSRSAAPVPFTDSDGDTYTVTLTGGGISQVTLDDLDADQKGPIASIALTGTKVWSALRVTVKKGETGDGKVSIGAITADASFGAVYALKSDLVGAGVTVAGVVKTSKFASIADGSVITLGTVAKRTPLALTAGAIGDATLTALSVGPGASIQAAQAATLKTTAGAFAGTVRIAGRVVALLVKGGNFTGQMQSAAINSISVKKDRFGAGGSIVDSTLAATGAIGAGVVGDPRDYRWCGYAAAVAGEKAARVGLAIVTEARRGSSVEAAAVLSEYRLLLFGRGEEAGVDDAGRPLRRGFQREEVDAVLAAKGQLDHWQMLRCRVRYFADGLALGSKAFVNEVFAARREHFGPKRMSGARALRGVEAQGLCALRDLRLRAVG